MKTRILVTILLIITILKADEPERSLSERAIETTSALISLVQAGNKKEIEKLLVPESDQKQLRHKATVASVLSLLGGYDTQKIITSKPEYFPEKKLVIIRIIEPIKLDFEYKIIDSVPLKILLSSIHP
jgi:hypothetical protein